MWSDAKEAAVLAGLAPVVRRDGRELAGDGLKVTGVLNVFTCVPAVTLYRPSTHVTTAVTPPGMSSFAPVVKAL